MKTPFEGFPPGKPRTAHLPTLFFTELLPVIDDLAELKVTLFAFYAIQQREGQYRYVRTGDFASQPRLIESLGTTPLHEALEAACKRGTLLRADVSFDGHPEPIYFINAEPGRKAIRQIASGTWRHGAAAHTIELLPERPTIYQLYENNIGALTGLIADHLKDAEQDYGSEWVSEAIQVAVTQEKRSWRYIAAILQRWRKEGKREIGRKDPIGERPTLAGNLDDFIDE